ncbi:potassium-transporting ATPase subunit KdpA [Fluoribacter dumoffii]|uniref:potassium-transporting ATPase subunit KdpA n=1 Tax=Fluoribacter dumoffii TaxID=463 RepID=UPI0022438035|nr:potassium-transporting ATPase subunit KdpA [Fluoribacter dumoffii]MCW8419325.1 potassium-transporting ATPase subunit KdpA [Fluoribacter dumoffii]MCW8452800.1 potassium-transporting ATPase subunit KdpA [Fluoribacter dumoffii]MCW8459950.1 potassium-transporting ATPase subunit KdpA [Fluoribacter dumoffii]MCW8483428.1 potassium-transporting ATPase subunit KdpA [Fluoribacter dumoffii]
MTKPGFLQLIFYLLFLLLLVKPLGWYMARVYQGRSCFLDVVLKPVEHFIYTICGIHAQEEMRWKKYLLCMLFINLFGVLFVYLIQRIQFYLPLNPQEFTSPSPDLAFNTAVSYATNTDWQAYSGEMTMSYFTQMFALTVQNFISAASSMSLLIALIRGLVRYESKTLGNFWVDTVRGILYILLPLSFIFALILCSQGVIQNFKPYQKISLLYPYTYQQPITDQTGKVIVDSHGTPETKPVKIAEQIIPMGPVATQVAIKQLGSNGGGYFYTNSAHPFENPTPLTNFLEMVAILLIPAAFCFTFGVMIDDKKQGWAILVAMSILFVPWLLLEIIAEQTGNPLFQQMGINTTAQAALYPAGNMEGKETRFGIVNSAIWATTTTAASHGSVNSMLDSFTPIGGLVPLWMMHLGEVSFGGVGSGLYGMIMLIVLTVFIAGLMVGRTPEYLGKKIEPYEMKMASIAVLIMPLTVLITTAYASVTPEGVSSIANYGAHGFTEMLYAFTSMANNNGSAFSGLIDNTSFYNIAGGLLMLISRYWIAIPVLAMAGSLVRKKRIPATLGTLGTHTPLFVTLLVGIAIVVGALSFFPALALGPIAEQLMLWRGYGH